MITIAWLIVACSVVKLNALGTPLRSIGIALLPSASTTCYASRFEEGEKPSTDYAEGHRFGEERGTTEYTKNTEKDEMGRKASMALR